MDDWFHVCSSLPNVNLFQVSRSVDLTLTLLDQGRNDSYVLTVEALLARAFFNDDDLQPKKKESSGPTSDANFGNVPPHFYRELARTSEGCKLLREKGHFEEFALFIREHGGEHEDPEIVTKVKGCLWAVGNIGSMPFGAPFLDEENIVQSIIKIAETSQVLTLKGTAFFVLGLIAKTMQGLEILLEHGWDGTTTTMGEPLGFCMPVKLEKLLSVRARLHYRHCVDAAIYCRHHRKGGVQGAVYSALTDRGVPCRV